MNKQKYAFTLVELIIVITILAILATIAFVSFQNYIKDSRDSNRLSSIRIVEKGLLTFQVSAGILPVPDNKVNITANGNIIGYQGNISDSVSKILRLNHKPLDPLDNSLFSYGIDVNASTFSLLTFLESKNISYLNNTFAATNGGKSPKVLGDNVGIFFDNSGVPIEQTGTGVDIYLTNQNFSVYFKNASLNGSGNSLRVLTNSYSKLSTLSYAKSCREIIESGISKGDGIYTINPNLSSTGTLQVYCDMTNQGGGWTAFYGVDISNVTTMGSGTIPGNSNFGQVGSSVWSSDLKNMIFSGIMINMYNYDNSLGLAYKYNLATQTGFILTKDNGFVVDNIVKPEPDCRFRIRYRNGWMSLYNWEVGINDADNGAIDATCAIGAGITMQSGVRKPDIWSSIDVKKFNKTLFFIK